MALCLAVGLALTGQLVLLPSAQAGTTLAVSTTADVSAGAGACGDGSITTAPSPLSLREATCLANNIGGDVTISVPAGIYNLTNGELRLGDEPGQTTSIVGAGSAGTVIDAGGLRRVLELDFNLTGGVDTSISGLTLRGGSDDTYGGAGIIAGSGTSNSLDHLTISASTITGNQTDAGGSGALTGGGVQFIGGVLSIVNSTISNNSSGNSSGAGIYYQGLGVVAGESLTITGSTFTGNSAGVGSGGAIAVNGGSAALHYNRFTGNAAATGSALSSGLGAGVNATENWWGCSSGPGSTGCDTASGGSTVSPRLTLTATANPATVAGPNGTSTITATLTRDSVGASVDPVQLGAFAGLRVSWTDPQPSGATVSAASSNLNAGSASATYNSNAAGGAGHVVATLDQGAATATLTVTFSQAPAISSADHTSFVVGSAGSFTITTTGYPAAMLSRTGAQFPAWLTLTDNGNGTGSLTGSPPGGSAGAYQFTLQATNSQGSVSQAFTLFVDDSPVITSANHASFTAGQAGSFVVTSTAGYPAGTALAESGALPAGVTFSDHGDGTAALAGTPAAGTGGTYPITITATAVGGLAPAATQPFTLTVLASPGITSADHATFAEGSAGSFTVTTSAGNPASTTLSKTGTLPAGISFIDNGNGVATIAGTPNVGSAGVYQIIVTASNGATPDVTQTFTLTVNGPPEFTSADHATFTVGIPVSFTVTTEGQPTPALSKTGTLPPGMTFADNGDGTATLGGTPTAGGSYTFTITASNGVLPKANQSFTATVYASPTITSVNNATFAVGSAGSFTVTTTPGIPVATAITESGSLPSGVTFHDNGNGTATLAGTPAAGTGGIYNLTLTASNGVSPNSTQVFGLTVTDLPVITSADHGSFRVGSAGSFTVTTRAGFPTVTSIAKTGTLPAGVTFTDNGNGTATLAGTPAAGTGGTYSLTLTAANSAGNSSQAFTLTVNEAPVITSANNATFTVGSAGTFTVTTTPTATSITETGALPSGVTFVDNGNGTATLTGTPAVGTGGIYNLTLTASNGVPPNATQTFGLTVRESPTITSADHTTFAVGSAGTFAVTSKTGFPTATTLTEAGSLPSGVTFTDNGDGTATLTGTPAVGTGGSYPLTVSASNSIGQADQAFTLTVTQPPVITSANNATFVVGSAGTFTVTSTPGSPAATTLTESGALPSGVTFTDNGNGTATLAGTPAAGTGGSYPITITASNGVLPNTTQAFTLTVTEKPSITSANKATFIVNTAGSFTVTTRAGFPTATTLTKVGTLPFGVTFIDKGNGTATLAGKPAASTGGTYSLTLTATNSAGSTSQAFTLTVGASPTINSANGTTFTVGTSGTFTVITSGGYPSPPALSETGALPAGVTFHDNGNGTATISGKPTVSGVFAITIKADNSVAPVTSQSFTLTVNGPPTITSADHTGFEVGSAGTFTVTTAPGTPAGAITLTKAGNLPDGVTFTDNRNGTATLAGTPANRTSGSYPLTFTASGSASNSTQAFTLIVGTPPQITSASTAFFSSNSMNTFAVTTSGGYPTPPALTETGALPSWLTFRDNGDGTATLSGVPPAGPLVGYSIEIRADNHVAKVTTQNFTLYVWNNTG